MDRVGIVLLAVVGMLTWIVLWIWFAMFGLSIGGRAIDPVLVYVRRKWLSWNQWINNYKNAANALQWSVWIAAVVALVFAFKIKSDHWLYDYRGEIAGIAFTVVVIEEVARLRSKIEFKRTILLQMGSRSNDFALDAARIAKAEGWLENGACEGAHLQGTNLKGAVLRGTNLKGANLSGAHLEGADLIETHLEGANLSEAHLEGANLVGTHLEGADLWRANLKGAKYWQTHWPAGFDPVLAGAVELVDGAELGPLTSTIGEDHG